MPVLNTTIKNKLEKSCLAIGGSVLAGMFVLTRIQPSTLYSQVFIWVCFTISILFFLLYLIFTFNLDELFNGWFLVGYVAIAICLVLFSFFYSRYKSSPKLVIYDEDWKRTVELSPTKDIFYVAFSNLRGDNENAISEGKNIANNYSIGTESKKIKEHLRNQVYENKIYCFCQYLRVIDKLDPDEIIKERKKAYKLIKPLPSLIFYGSVIPERENWIYELKVHSPNNELSDIFDTNHALNPLNNVFKGKEKIRTHIQTLCAYFIFWSDVILNPLDVPEAEAIRIHKNLENPEIAPYSLGRYYYVRAKDKDMKTSLISKNWLDESRRLFLSFIAIGSENKLTYESYAILGDIYLELAKFYLAKQEAVYVKNYCDSSEVFLNKVLNYSEKNKLELNFSITENYIRLTNFYFDLVLMYIAKYNKFDIFNWQKICDLKTNCDKISQPYLRYIKESEEKANLLQTLMKIDKSYKTIKEYIK